MSTTGETGYEVVGIGEAAVVLGVSRSTVQKMVDGGELRAVRTLGGHRRILRESLRAYVETRQRSSVAAGSTEKLQVLVAEDNPLMQQTYRFQFERSGLPAAVTFAADAIEALLTIDRQRPHVVVTDLCMQPFDGFHLIATLRGKPEFADIGLAVVTGLSATEIDARGGLPPSVPVFSKPAPWERLIGFLQGHNQARLGAYMDRGWCQPVPSAPHDEEGVNDDE